MANTPRSSSYGENPDVTFVFPKNGGATIKAEKGELMKMSEVFRTQFSSDFVNIQPIEIIDISFEVFNELMEMMELWNHNKYHSIFVTDFIDESNYQEILYAATKYFIYPIISVVIHFSLNFIELENVVDVYEFFDKYDIPKINEHILKVCVENPVEIIAKLSGSNIHMKLLKEILQSPFMNCSEYELYNTVRNALRNAIPGHVVDVAAEMRQRLGNLIYLFKFSTMTVQELILCGNPPSLLTGEQINDLLLWVELGLYSQVVSKFSNTKPRVNL